MTIFVMTKFVVMRTMALILSELRTASGLSVKALAQMANVDQGLLSKYENGKRLPSEAHVNSLSEVLKDKGVLRKYWLAEKVAQLVRYEEMPSEVFEVAESRVEYLRSTAARDISVITEEVEALLSKIDDLHQRWLSCRPLQSTQLAKMNDYFNTQYTYESNQIEGNTLTLQETHLVINEGLTISGKSMREHLEAVNHKEAIDFVRDLVTGKEDLSPRTLLEIHRLILKTIDSDNAGRFRSVPVRIMGSRHEPPQPYLLDKLMEEYHEFYGRFKNVIHPVILAAEMHERLVSIHPFIDGNGRTSRLVMNLILLSHGYTVTSLKGSEAARLEYYRALEATQVDNDPSIFHDLICRAVIESLEAHLALV